MTRVLFALPAIALVVWHQVQPDIAIYAVFLFAGAGIRALCLAVEGMRGRR